MSLREELADKFEGWRCAQCDLPRSEWLEMADECIRQMEWAQSKGATYCPFCGGPPHAALTLAPEDWNP